MLSIWHMMWRSPGPGPAGPQAGAQWSSVIISDAGPSGMQSNSEHRHGVVLRLIIMMMSAAAAVTVSTTNVSNGIALRVALAMA